MRYFLEEFLSKWRLLNGEIYVLVGSRNIDGIEHCDEHAQLTVDEYLQVVEVYLRTVIEIGLNDVDLAVSWVENAALPEEKRQVFMFYCMSFNIYIYRISITSYFAKFHI